MESYSNALLKFIATHLLDIAGGKITPEEMQDFAKSMGRKNPMETAWGWMIDFNVAFHALAPRGIWDQVARDGLSEPMLYHLGRLDKRDDSGPIPYPLSTMQRLLVNDCILKGCTKVCKRTGSRGPDVCWNEPILTRMRHFLNGEGRDSQGKFIQKEIKQ